MKLTKYRVTKFRSVQDSSWIDCDDVTTLVGVNESGKSNLLLALWKLNPARAGNIDILHDMPVSELSDLRKHPEDICFVTADFLIDEVSAQYISKTVGCRCAPDTHVEVSRYYDGHYCVNFPDGAPDPEEAEAEDEPAQKYDDDKLRDAVVHEIPKFVYYSNYGNLSTRIYLPNVITWLDGGTVTGIDVNEDQVRTLRVLFDFVNLDPKEILELGKDPKVVALQRTRSSNATPTPDEIAKAEQDKEQRSILLQSASGRLTKEFKDWWKQGEYKFRFEADGDYFRIWVSDHVRTEEVGLELRSTGLQWFLSFYLIFLVESQNQHKNAILLLDEAGLTLHPLAQKDLALFFENLATNNQIINTTHSPFIVDTANIDRCRVVYVDSNGYTVASSNLRQGADALNERSIYAVHAAMGLSVSDIMLQGCQPIVVEGPSDQHYLNAIKAFLIREKFIAPKQEMVFIPSGGVKGVPGVVSIACGKSEQLPYVLLDSDSSGTGAKGKLQSGLYRDNTTKILSVNSFCDVDRCEVEDLIPFALLDRGITRLFLTVEDYSFVDDYDATKPIIPQIESFAARHNVSLPEGWKVDLAKSSKQALRTKTVASIDPQYLEMWKKLFETLNT